MEKIKVVYKEVGKEPKVIEIENKLKKLQELVGGFIEVVCFHNFDDRLLIICNEEGKILNLEPNIILDYDYIAGNCLFISDESGEFKGLNDKQIEKVMKYASINTY